MCITLLVVVVLSFVRVGITQHPYDYRRSSGLFPSVFNLAEGADIFSNTTCGASEQEIYCKLLSETSSARQCGICDAAKKDKNHPIEFAIDGNENTWWQASSLQTGLESNYATITVDLKEVFQVAYVLITTGISPRPGNWLLERSIDGKIWAPWQFFADSDEECWTAFGVEPRKDKPSYHSDAEVICTSYYSKLEPLEHAQIHVSLVNGRPGASGPSRTLVDFIQARFIRFRFLKLQLLPSDSYLMSGFNAIRADDSIATQARRYFYSIKDITIGGQCPCNGHANECPVDHETMKYECKCKHNTCGTLCNQCCPMYNQKRWRPGKFISGNYCERCQCFNHADECYFDPQVEAERKSLNSDGKYEGGGVCINCRDETIGINCESCREGFYRPNDMSQFDSKPCRRCDCDSINNPGSTGSCYPNQVHDSEKRGGDCVCKEGYTGKKCEKCDRGYHGYPNCIPCTCNLAGTKNGACIGYCECKDNVIGSSCDACKPGYFALHESNSNGCLKCFCYGVTEDCEAAYLGVEVLQHGEGWKVTDLRRSVVVEPYWSTVTNGVTVAEEDMQGIETYFWEAPSQYIGNRLVSYGQEIRVRTSWHKARGDTAGSPIRAPEVILEGENMMIAYGTTRYKNRNNATINVNLVEEGWYHIPSNLRQIKASGSDNEIPDFVGLPVSKVEFMKVLGSMARMLFRSKYHTDQLEGTLHTAEIEFGSERSVSLKKTLAVERCICPPGYEGLSCEQCSYGYTRYNETLYEGMCRKCNCNGHAASCDPYTLKCAECQHNTIGDQCERCIDGFYGNPLSGTPADCKPCKCPLDISSNNFSPTCQEVSSLDYDKYSLAPNEYVCNACPRGYAGPHCERCENGYFGNPLAVGNVCKPCDCNGNSNPYSPDWCDHRTGQCLICMGNTIGRKCERCMPGFYGNALAGRCLPCDCNPYGSSSTECHPTTGQCNCREKKYLGRTCSKCKDGFGNLRAGCRQCNCNPTGSVSDFCDAHSGQCHCRPGIDGLTCDKCKPFNFGFSIDGCRPCNCHPHGSKEEQCDLFNGQCYCKDNVHGSQCEECMVNYWNINSKKGCTKCRCDMMGSAHNDCDDISGQCACKPGVGGTLCDACVVGFWGFSPTGCKKCFPCDKPGHVCDPDTGRCICPPLTHGDDCSLCASGTWDYHSYKGCQYCKCHSKGSLSEQCDLLNGQCKCMTGFEGQLCDQCSPGYYNFPNCRPCNCNPAGTASGECFDDGLCKCNEDGACSCKENVEGKKCASCKLGTFGLSLENPLGCTNCFCFDRTQSCTQADYFWTQLAFPEGRTLSITRGNSPLNVTEGLTLIPFQEFDVSIGILGPYEEPLYWDLTTQFLGDKLTSYNGYIRFTIHSDGELSFKSAPLFPLVQIQGVNGIVIEHYQRKISSSGRYEVRLLEKEWKLRKSRTSVNRETLMIVLQNVKKILVRATDKMKATKIQLKGVTLDVGKPLLDQGRSLRLAVGVEQCDCPKEYSSSSCQNPGKGYYRNYDKHEEETITTSFIKYVGNSRQCSCNGRTNECAPETGLCLNCRDNTAGLHCDICTSGYYGSPNQPRGCQPCKCPSASRNFATTCSVNEEGIFFCECQKGYTGPKCEQCDYGYYGSPKSENGKCVPCNCNELGSLSDQCHSKTGQCSCASLDIVGRDCSQCQPRHILTRNQKCQNCEDSGCTSYLLNFVDLMENVLWAANVTELDPAPNIRLTNLKRRSSALEDDINAALRNKNRMIQIHKIGSGTEPQSEIIQLEVNKNLKTAKKLAYEAENIYQESINIETDISIIRKNLRNIVDRLNSYSVSGIGSEASINQVLFEAKQWLNEMKTHNFGEIDINARTELSHARILHENMKKLIYGTNEIPRLKEDLYKGENKLNDLLKFIDHGLGNSRFTANKNRKNNLTLYEILNSFTKTILLNQKSDKTIFTSLNMYQNGHDVLGEAWESFSALPDKYKILSGSVGKTLEDEEIGISGVVEDYRQRYIEPCEQHGLQLQK
nr:laminin subunit alpha-1-like isoform X1 [Lepeophtheirus salmonis]